MNPFNNTGNIASGSQGALVSQLQSFLNDQGFNAGQVDGIFGTNTQTAVEQFQQAQGLDVDGIVGVNTTQAINNLLGQSNQQGGEDEFQTSGGMMVTSDQAINQFQEDSNQLNNFQQTNEPSDFQLNMEQDGTGEDPFISGINSRISEIEQMYDDEIRAYDRELQQARERASESSTRLIDSIRRTYDQRRERMRESNRRFLASKEDMGIRQGRSRYLQRTQAGIIADEEQAGINRIAELDAEEFSLITQAEQARDEDDFNMLTQSIRQINEMRKQKEQAIKDLHKQVMDREKALLDAEREQRLQRASELDNMLSISAEVAPAVREQIQGFSAQEQEQFLRQYAQMTGIDYDILYSDVLGVRNDLENQRIDNMNRMSLINQRNANADDNTNEDEIGSGNMQTSLPMDEKTASELLDAGFTYQDIISIQNYLNQGGTLEELASANSFSQEQYQLLEESVTSQ